MTDKEKVKVLADAENRNYLLLHKAITMILRHQNSEPITAQKANDIADEFSNLVKDRERFVQLIN